MKITVLCENSVGEAGAGKCLAEWGLSLFIEMDGAKILFDTGRSDVYWRNAKSLGIDLSAADFVVLSHRHWDHAGGLQLHEFQEKKKLILHPAALEKIYPEQVEKIRNDFAVIESADPLEFCDNAFYLGRIPRIFDFEKGIFKNDQMEDDSALAIKTKKGVVIISGCSHAGICNICEYAKKITGQKLYAIIGGFHLLEENRDATEHTIRYFKKEKPDFLYPMHCIDLPTLARFYYIFGVKKLSAGDILELN